MWVIYPFGLAVELHVHAGIIRIQAATDTVFAFGTLAVDGSVLLYQRIHLSERKERTELQCGGRMRFDERIADQNAVFVGYEDFFLGEDHTSHTVCGAWHAFAVKFADIFVPFWIVDSAAVAVQAKIERCSVLYYGLVQ